MRLDQGDLDCWMAVVQAYIESDKDHEGRFVVSGNRLLELMGSSNTGPNHNLLDDRLSKLRSGSIDIKTGRFSYEGSLIEDVYRDSETRQVAIKLNPHMFSLFVPENGWTRMDLAVRKKLGRNNLAKWVYAFFSSHEHHFPISVEKIKELSDSDYRELWRFRQALKKSIDLVNKATGWKLQIDAKTDLLVGHPILGLKKENGDV
jgi:hypothetical protein